VLSIHEAVPGHHLADRARAGAREQPKFRRTLEATAYTEGWALYSESLGEEMGFYADPYDKFGQLTYEMWRAVRLVVDTGCTTSAGPRAGDRVLQANARRASSTSSTRSTLHLLARQALAYKSAAAHQGAAGAATAALGPKFDIREFHDLVLGSGAVPLDILESNVEQWLSARAATGERHEPCRAPPEHDRPHRHVAVGGGTRRRAVHDNTDTADVEAPRCRCARSRWPAPSWCG